MQTKEICNPGNHAVFLVGRRLNFEGRKPFNSAERPGDRVADADISLPSRILPAKTSSAPAWHALHGNVRRRQVQRSIGQALGSSNNLGTSERGQNGFAEHWLD